jgi:hypothetical protein
MKKYFLVLILIMLIAAPILSARAQAAAYAEITQPDTSAFPIITTLIDAYDANGQFVPIDDQSLILIENGTQIQPDAIVDLAPGIKFIVAVNAGPAIAARDGSGISRYDKAMRVITNWAATRPSSSKDKTGLTSNNGAIFFDVNILSWAARTRSFDPDARKQTPSLSALSYAIDLAETGALAPGGKRAILLLSPHIENRELAGLETLIARAAASQIRVFVWLIDSESYFDHNGAIALADLARRTGGKIFFFSGSETLPDPESLAEPLRHAIQVSYASQIRSGGTHTLVAQVNTSDAPLTTSTRMFDLNVQPPNPILLSPPNQIVRQNEIDPFDLAGLTPREQVIDAIIEFADGHPRHLTRTALYVDDQLVHENTSEPFDRFYWSLEEYQQSGAHFLRVEAEDSLGLKRASIDTPIQVTVIQPPGGIEGLMMRYREPITIGVVSAAGVILAAVFAIAQARKRRHEAGEQTNDRRRKNDPVSQPVSSVEDRSNQPKPVSSFWMRRRAPAAPAYLAPLMTDGQPASGDPLPLAGNEFTFGSDPSQAAYPLDDASLSPLHARLKVDDKGNYTLFDQNSTAGTWVNYESIGKEGQMLKHGDVVNFGKLTFRFVLRKAPNPIKPSIFPTNDPS